MSIQPTPETILTPDVLAHLVTQRQTFEETLTVGKFHDRLRFQTEEYFGVVKSGRYVGLISQAQIGLKLSGRFGYALYSKQPIDCHVMPDTLVVTPGETLLTVLDRALNRAGSAF